jgi:hypothetical protein
MSKNRINASNAFVSNIDKLTKIIEHFHNYNGNAQFFYSNNTIYDDVYSVDITAFNIQFLTYVNRFIQHQSITSYIQELQHLEKSNRVIEYGLFFREVVKHNIKLNQYMLAVRNIFFKPFINRITSSQKTYQLYRMNYDDIEFSTHEPDISVDLFITNHFLDVATLKHYDKVIVLTKKDGVFYVKDKKIIDIKYTSGWVNIPAYRFLINAVVMFMLSDDYDMGYLNKQITEYIEFAPNDHFFGYDDDEISKKFDPNEIVPISIRYLFVANVMSKFSILFKN